MRQMQDVSSASENDGSRYIDRGKLDRPDARRPVKRGIARYVPNWGTPGDCRTFR